MLATTEQTCYEMLQKGQNSYSISFFFRYGNAVKNTSRQILSLQSSPSISEHRAWLTYLETMLPRLLSRLVFKYIPQLL